MEPENRRPNSKSIVFSFAVPATAALVAALLAIPHAAAQGTAEQRAACEDEARWLCSNYIPDAEAIKGCMLRNLNQLSPRCRAMFDHGSKRRGRHAKHAK
jgi:hypothetical protein